MQSATVQSAKIDSIIVNIPRFIDIPFRESARIEGSGCGCRVKEVSLSINLKEFYFARCQTSQRLNRSSIAKPVK
jgi:hypothetical protein